MRIRHPHELKGRQVCRVNPALLAVAIVAISIGLNPATGNQGEEVTADPGTERMREGAQSDPPVDLFEFLSQVASESDKFPQREALRTAELGFFDKLEAGFRIQSPIMAIVRRHRMTSGYSYDPEFPGVANLDRETYWQLMAGIDPSYAHAMADATSMQQAIAIREVLLDRQRDHAILETSGFIARLGYRTVGSLEWFFLLGFVAWMGLAILRPKSMRQKKHREQQEPRTLQLADPEHKRSEPPHPL